MNIDILFSIAILIMSVVAHEVAHGVMAEKLGDPTARLAGRLTLNPIKHLDPIGSFVMPILTSMGGFTFGWAKPVPYNPYNLKNQRWGPAMVAAAGPLTNLAIALIAGFAIRFFGPELTAFGVITVVGLIVQTNVLLMIFNFIPIPPLDGSKVLFSALPYRYQSLQAQAERYSLFVLLFFVFFLWQFFIPVVQAVSRLIIGF